MDLKKVVEFETTYWPNSCKNYHYKLEENHRYSIYYLVNWLPKFCKSNKLEFVGVTEAQKLDSFDLIFKDKNGSLYIHLVAFFVMNNVITGVLSSLRKRS